MKSVYQVASGLKRRITGTPILRQGEIRWESLRFHFAADDSTFIKAQERGIENGLCRLAVAVCGEGSIAVDVGMNYGFVTTIMAHAVGRTGQVHAFDPVPMYHSVVKKSLRATRLQNVTLYLKAAGARAGLLPIQLAAWDRTIQATVVALEEELRDLPRLDFLKIDVDGPELDVLIGARQLLESYHPVVAVELNKQHDEILGMLSELGYTHFMNTDNQPLKPGQWPGNLIASVGPVRVPLSREMSSIESRSLP